MRPDARDARKREILERLLACKDPREIVREILGGLLARKLPQPLVMREGKAEHAILGGEGGAKSR